MPPPQLSSQQRYYWYQGKKIHLEPASSRAIIRLAEKDTRVEEKLKEVGLVNRGDVGREDLLIVESENKSDVAPAIGQLRSRARIARTFSSYKTRPSGGDTYEVVPFDELFVKFQPSLTPKEIQTLIRQYQLEMIDVNEFGRFYFRVKESSVRDALGIGNELYERGLAEWAEPNFVVDVHPHEDRFYPRQWHLHNTGQIQGGVPGVDINAPEAWYATTGSSTITVAVLDDGVEPHEDLPSSRLLPGWTVGGGNGTPSTGDEHGEAVAGIIAATHNGVGVRGVAPGVKIISVKMISNGIFSSFGAIAACIDTARRRGADVINIGWGVLSSSNISVALNNAFTLGRNGKGCVLVASGGNHYVTEFPANYDSVIAVGGITFKNTQPQQTPADDGVDVVAPTWIPETPPSAGGGLHTCEGCLRDSAIVTIDRTGPAGYLPGDYITIGFTGTSAAAPQVSGVAALLLSHNPNLVADTVRKYIRESATNYGNTNWDGYGRLDAAKALERAGALVGAGCEPDCPPLEKPRAVLPVESAHRFELSQNFPNPSNPSTRIAFELDKDRLVRLTIHDLLGRLVTTLTNDWMLAGRHEIEWDASSVPTGVYFCRLTSEGETKIQKLVISK